MEGLRGKAGWLLLWASVTVAIGCTSTPPPTQAPASLAPSAAATAVADAAECARLIGATSLADPASIQAVDACRYRAAGAQASRAVLVANTAGPDQLWAALWVYAASSNDPAPLLPFASNSDPTLRAMASATLVAFGDRSGFAPLAQLLADTSTMYGSLPPLTIGAYTAAALLRYVVAGSAPSPDLADDPTAHAAVWQAWLNQNAAELQYSPADGIWTLP